MIVRVPAVVLGLFIVFLFGSFVTYNIVRLIGKPTYISEDLTEKISCFGGGVAVVLVIILYVTAPRETANQILGVLVGIGIIFGLSTFLLAGV